MARAREREKGAGAPGLVIRAVGERSRGSPVAGAGFDALLAKRPGVGAKGGGPKARALERLGGQEGVRSPGGLADEFGVALHQGTGPGSGSMREGHPRPRGGTIGGRTSGVPDGRQRGLFHGRPD